MRRAAFAVVAVSVGALLGGCSHKIPYVRDTLSPPTPPFPEPQQILQRLILIGDAGAPALRGEPVLELLRDTVSQLPAKTVVVFLGDNIYPRGLPFADADGRAEAEAALNAQIAAVDGARGIFVPGNHDWENSYAGGLSAILRQGAYLAEHDGVELSPAGGCAGPTVHELNSLRLIALDTQWWLHGHDRGVGCRAADSVAVKDSLVALLEVPDGREVVVVGHHPLVSRGPHDGFHTVGEWIFPSLMADNWMRWILLPLPALGPLVRWAVRSDQDFGSTGNRSLREQLAAALATSPPLAYAAGHEHSLQVFEGDPIASLLLVSGLGSQVKGTPVGDESRTLFAQSKPGFMVLDVLEDEVMLRVMGPEAGGPVFWHRVPRRHGRP